MEKHLKLTASFRFDFFLQCHNMYAKIAAPILMLLDFKKAIPDSGADGFELTLARAPNAISSSRAPPSTRAIHLYRNGLRTPSAPFLMG